MKNTPNPNWARSGGNPKGNRNDPPIDWPNHNKHRKSEVKYHNERMVKVADKLHEILDISQREHDLRISAILVSIVKSKEKLGTGKSISFAYPKLTLVYFNRQSCGWLEMKRSAVPRLSTPADSAYQGA